MPNYWRVLNKVISESDLLLEVLDARMVDMTRNPELEDKINKPIIYVLNKCDLITQQEGDNLKKKFAGKAVFVSTKKYYGIQLLKIKIHKLLPKNKKSIIGVVGYPNTGKSSLINALTSRGAARTSPRAGFTKGAQLINMSKYISLLDTPGVIPYKEKDEVKHGLISSIDASELKDPDVVAMQVIRDKPEEIKTFYNIEIGEDEHETLLAIGKSLNCIRKGGIIDERAASIRIIQDWQRGKLR
jgi:ribosome biogenesis GTPase A